MISMIFSLGIRCQMPFCRLISGTDNFEYAVKSLAKLVSRSRDGVIYVSELLLTIKISQILQFNVRLFPCLNVNSCNIMIQCFFFDRHSNVGNLQCGETTLSCHQQYRCGSKGLCLCYLLLTQTQQGPYIVQTACAGKVSWPGTRAGAHAFMLLKQ